MIKLLENIIIYLSALFNEHGFFIKESKNSGNRFSGASILLASSEIEIFLAIERDEITVYFRSLFDRRKSNWYSAEIVLALVGYKDGQGVMDDRCFAIIKDKLPVILKCFSNSEAKETLRLLDEIEKEMSKRI